MNDYPDPQDPRPGLSPEIRNRLNNLPSTYYIGPTGGVHLTPRGAWEENAFFEESHGRTACNRMLDNPDAGK